ncbi:hypothetical protein HDV02_000166 [Globomyces sp. JEL0801]|nr:hypothetical protein HDV02_000166 [Globomyces sp. JEL0801]
MVVSKEPILPQELVRIRRDEHNLDVLIGQYEKKMKVEWKLKESAIKMEISHTDKKNKAKALEQIECKESIANRRIELFSTELIKFLVKYRDTAGALRQAELDFLEKRILHRGGKNVMDLNHKTVMYERQVVQQRQAKNDLVTKRSSTKDKKLKKQYAHEIDVCDRNIQILNEELIRFLSHYRDSIHSLCAADQQDLSQHILLLDELNEQRLASQPNHVPIPNDGMPLRGHSVNSQSSYDGYARNSHRVDSFSSHGPPYVDPDFAGRVNSNGSADQILAPIARHTKSNLFRRSNYTQPPQKRASTSQISSISETSKVDWAFSSLASPTEFASSETLPSVRQQNSNSSNSELNDHTIIRPSSASPLVRDTTPPLKSGSLLDEVLNSLDEPSSLFSAVDPQIVRSKFSDDQILTRTPSPLSVSHSVHDENTVVGSGGKSSKYSEDDYETLLFKCEKLSVEVMKNGLGAGYIKVTEELAESKKEIERLESQLLQMRKEKLDTQSIVPEDTLESLSNAKLEIRALTLEKDKALDNHAMFEKKLLLLEKEHESLKSKHADLNQEYLTTTVSSELTIATLEAQLEDKDMDMLELKQANQKEVDELILEHQQRISDLQKVSEVVEQLEMNLEKVEGEKHQSLLEITKLEEEIVMLNEEKQSMENEMKDMQLMINDSKLTRKTTSRQADNINSELQIKIGLLEEENQRLKVELQSKANETPMEEASVPSKSECDENLVIELQAQLEEMTKESLHLKNQLISAEKEYTKASNMMDRKSNEMHEMTRAFDERVELFNSTIRQLNDQVESLQMDVEEKEAMNSQLVQQLFECRQEINQLQTEATISRKVSTSTVNSDRLDSNSSQDQLNKPAKAKSSAPTEELYSLQLKYTQLIDDFQQSNQEIESLKKKLQIEQVNVEDLTKTLDELTSQSSWF